jgi:hypothetical protein
MRPRLVFTLLAAVLGGLPAWRYWVSPWSGALVVSVAALLATGLAWLLTEPPARQAGVRSTPAAARSGPPVPPRETAPAAGLPGGPRSSRPAPAPGWWTENPVSAPDRAAPSSAVASEELAPADQAAQIVQCPDCGGFRLDLSERRGLYAFGCRDCDHRWEWRLGRPWPPLVVRRNLTDGPPAEH